MIRFYFNLAPNPTKVALALEELGLPYEIVPVDTRKGEQHAPAFWHAAPTGKQPVGGWHVRRNAESTAQRPEQHCVEVVQTPPFARHRTLTRTGRRRR